MITATTIFFYRRRETSAQTYHVWGYPVIPILFVAAAAVLLVYSYAENLSNSLIGTGIILLGVPLFLVFRKRGALQT
jgi:APA family basic amino acid/polyamine antiporter